MIQGLRSTSLSNRLPLLEGGDSQTVLDTYGAPEHDRLFIVHCSYSSIARSVDCSID
jgi:hypothetical protein